ncbi:MAG: D-glycero-beta-D-manno-heptose 1-phosphate adenylyltransferase [Mariprofundaceae bacterium]|nr:D-glycero-beta-D-manno-heptose 1-phosphate adenylyltransferase [Mariprofundaceae bacterium]
MEDSLLALEKLCQQRKIWKEQGKRVVFTNGCFDLLHPGHIAYLQDAKALGDILIIGLNDDASIGRLKGNGRPINSLKDRAMMLMALKPVDKVVVFSEDTPLNLISALLPDVLVKGGDYTIDNIVGADVVQAAGGEVTTIAFLDGYSSTRLIQKIIALDA